jgi:small-conductance mechanosensitive channel
MSLTNLSELLQEQWFIYALALAVGFPLAILSLGELIHRYRKNGKSIAETLSIVRNFVLPIWIILLFCKYVLEFDSKSSSIKLLETLFWICALNATLSLTNSILFSEAGESSWRSKMPKLLIDLTRLFLIGIGIAIVLSRVWGANLAGLVAALGVSLIVLGLALQDTLGSVMSGIALLFERPFSVGDWLASDGIIGKVIDINWRAVRLETRSREMIVIPHKLISSQVIKNYSQPLQIHGEPIIIGFSYDHPPNLVKKVLYDTALSTQGVLFDPEPRVRVVGYEDFEITYKIIFFVENYHDIEEIQDRLMTRIWYAAQRNELTLPYPIRTVYNMDSPPSVMVKQRQTTEQFTKSLQSIPVFVPLTKNSDSLDNFAKGAAIQKFGVGEKIIHVGEIVQSLYIITSGHAIISVPDRSGREREVLKMSPGEFFGEMALFSSEPSQISITALDDLEVIAIFSDVVDLMLSSQPSLAREIGQIIEARQKAIDLIEQRT